MRSIKPLIGYEEFSRIVRNEFTMNTYIGGKESKTVTLPIVVSKTNCIQIYV